MFERGTTFFLAQFFFPRVRLIENQLKQQLFYSNDQNINTIQLVFNGVYDSESNLMPRGKFGEKLLVKD